MSCKPIKRCHRKRSGRIDRMSDLPDSIIHHILSFMDAKDAVRSSILSKRFTNLWTEAPCLNFERSTMKIVRSTVNSHKRMNLQKVTVLSGCDSESYYDSQTEFCGFIRLLGLAKVKEYILDLEHKAPSSYSLPEDFYSNPSLKKLTLTYAYLETNGFVNWKSLQSLSLNRVTLPLHTINDILSGCPSLELFVLSNSSFHCRINLTNNRSLRKLVIDDCCVENTIEISAPHLQSLVLLGGKRLSKYKLLNVNSLIDCCLGFNGNIKLMGKDVVIQMLTSLLADLSRVETVTIGKWVLRVLSLMELNELPCPISKTIKLLKLRSSFTYEDMTGVACLLRNLNRLEKLVIEIRYYDPLVCGACFSYQDRECLKNKGYGSSKMLENLKTVEILRLREYQGVRFPYDLFDILSFVEFLLKKAKVLENMIITARGSMHYLKEKLNDFPRSSPRAQVKIVDC